jgi:hypothetical protein
VLLRFFMWFGRLPPRTRTIVLVGGFLGYNTLRRTAVAEPGLRPFILPVLVLYLVFVALTWLADPLMNLLLMARPEGRRLLRAEERRGAVLVACCLAAGVALGVAAGVTNAPRLALPALGVGFASFAVAAAYGREGRKRRQLQVLAAVAVAGSLLSAVAPRGVGGALFLAAVLSSAAATWLSHFGSDRPRRAG